MRRWCSRTRWSIRPAQVQQLISDMAGRRQARRRARLREEPRRCCRSCGPAPRQIEFWQTGWLSPKVQQKYYAYNPQEARQYFAYNNVRDGILKLTEDLFQVDIRPWDTPMWNEDVETYEMVSTAAR